jgi:hypothetical protein
MGERKAHKNIGHFVHSVKAEFGMSPAKTPRSQRPEKMHRMVGKIINLPIPNMACFAPWRENHYFFAAITFAAAAESEKSKIVAAGKSGFSPAVAASMAT